LSFSSLFHVWAGASRSWGSPLGLHRHVERAEAESTRLGDYFRRISISD
jgi:hypothetical protein